MPVTKYSSLDAAAPVLTGETGKLNDLLRAILVDGYGALAAAGWTEAYNDAASKTKCFRPAAGPQHYFQFKDAGPGAGTFKEARCRAYVSMSAYDTGTEPFPTVAQYANGQFVRKSASADATARAWRAVADTKTLYLGICTGDTANAYSWYAFGAMRSWKTADAYASMIAARILENNATMSASTDTLTTASALLTVLNEIYAPRSYTALGTSVEMGLLYNGAPGSFSIQTPIGGQGVAYPNPVDGGILLSPLYLNELNIMRGTVPGMWSPNHARPILHDDTFTALDGAINRTFTAYNLHSAGQVMIETSDTWYND